MFNTLRPSPKPRACQDRTSSGEEKQRSGDPVPCNTATGKFQQSGKSFLLTQTKGKSQVVANIADKAPEKLKEAWVGELEMGIMNPVMQFRQSVAQVRRLFDRSSRNSLRHVRLFSTLKLEFGSNCG